MRGIARIDGEVSCSTIVACPRCRMASRRGGRLSIRDLQQQEGHEQAADEDVAAGEAAVTANVPISGFLGTPSSTCRTGRRAATVPLPAERGTFTRSGQIPADARMPLA